MCDFWKHQYHLIITIKTRVCVEFVKKCIYSGLSNTVVYVKDIIIRNNWPQQHFLFTKSSANLEILTSIVYCSREKKVHQRQYNFDSFTLIFSGQNPPCSEELAKTQLHWDHFQRIRCISHFTSDISNVAPHKASPNKFFPAFFNYSFDILFTYSSM